MPVFVEERHKSWTKAGAPYASDLMSPLEFLQSKNDPVPLGFAMQGEEFSDDFLALCQKKMGMEMEIMNVL
jgi:hypothetical protein